VVAGTAALARPPALPAEGLTLGGLAAVVAGVTPAAVAMGAAFPFFVRLAVRGEAIGGSFGALSAWNTAGGIAGALLAPFVLLPIGGPARAAHACAAASLALAVALLWAGSAAARAALARVGAAAAVVALAAALPRAAAPGPDAGARLLFAAHGRQATAVVAQVSGRRDLIVDGDPEASTGGDARRTEELLEVLPLLLHPAPERLLEVGLGSGITFATAARFPVAELDCVEIADSVIRASRYFAPDNRIEAPGQRIRIVSGDARVFAARHPGVYDVVVANTLHPWSVGSTGLYSAEYFARLLAALRPGGIVGQWLPIEGIHPDDLAAILRTFYAVFPDGGLWWGAGNLIAVGSAAEIPVPDEAALTTRLAAARLDDRRRDLPGPAELRASRIAGAAAVRTALGAGEILSDDRPVLEASGARRRADPRGNAVWDLLVRISEAARTDSEPTAAARAWLRARAAHARGDAARSAAWEAEAAALGLSGPVARARAQPHVDEGYRALSEGRLGAAEAAFRAALRLDADQRDARFGLAGAALLAGRRDAAIAELRALVERFPDDAAAHNELSGALTITGDRRGARRAAERALDANPFFPEALANAGLLAAAEGDLDIARQLLERLREVTPLGPSPEEQALRRAVAAASSP
jgi:spermidine synthase